MSAKSPYVGPRPFRGDERALFFGRERERAELRDLILTYRVVLLYAQSGAGKTSLVNAGVLPLLESDVCAATVRLQGQIPPGIEIREEDNLYVIQTLASYGGPGTEIADLRTSRLADILKAPKTKDLLLVCDQFEEFFTAYPERWAQRDEWFAQLKSALRDEPALRVLFVIREDYLAELDPYGKFLPDGFRIRFRLERLRTDVAVEAIRQPARQAGREFAPGAAEELAANLSRINVRKSDGTLTHVAGEYVEPVYLQVVCEQLWRGLEDRKIVTSEDIRRFADVDAALLSFYEQGLAAAAKAAGESRLRKWFEAALITPAETRGIVFEGPERTAELPNATVRQLVELRLVRAEPRAGATWYELAHDRLIEPILKSNRNWRQRRARGRRRIAWGVAALAILVAAPVWLTRPKSVPPSNATLTQALADAERERAAAQISAVRALSASITPNNVDSVAGQLIQNLQDDSEQVRAVAADELSRIRFSVLDPATARRLAVLPAVSANGKPPSIEGTWDNTFPGTTGVKRLEIRPGPNELEIAASTSRAPGGPVSAQAARSTLPQTVKLPGPITLSIAVGTLPGQLFVETHMKSPTGEGESQLKEVFTKVYEQTPLASPPVLTSRTMKRTPDAPARAADPGTAAQPPAPAPTASVPPPTTPAETSVITINLFDGTRRPIASDSQRLITAQDGNGNIVVRTPVKSGNVVLKGLPFYNNFADNYTVMASADGFRQTGYFPVRVSPQRPESVDLMLLRKNASYDFSAAKWAKIAAERPAWMTFLSGGEQWYSGLPEDSLANLLNTITALESIRLPTGSALQHLASVDSVTRNAVIAYAGEGLLTAVKQAAHSGMFHQAYPGIFHPGATDGYKQVQFGEANLTIFFYESDRRTVNGNPGMKAQIEFDYFKDSSAHVLLDTNTSRLGQPPDPKDIYLLRWMASRHAGVPEFNPPYTIQ